MIFHILDLQPSALELPSGEEAWRVWQNNGERIQDGASMALDREGRVSNGLYMSVVISQRIQAGHTWFSCSLNVPP